MTSIRGWGHLMVQINPPFQTNRFPMKLLAELVGKRCCAFLMAHRAKEIEFPLDASTSGGTKAIAAAVIGQTSMNLGDSDVIVKNRDKTSRKAEDDAFAQNVSRKTSSRQSSIRTFERDSTIRNHPLPTWPSLHANLVSPKHESAMYRQIWSHTL